MAALAAPSVARATRTTAMRFIFHLRIAPVGRCQRERSMASPNSDEPPPAPWWPGLGQPPPERDGAGRSRGRRCERVIQQGDMVVMGFGGLNDGYGSDTARTVHVGERCDPATRSCSVNHGLPLSPSKRSCRCCAHPLSYGAGSSKVRGSALLSAELGTHSKRVAENPNDAEGVRKPRDPPPHTPGARSGRAVPAPTAIAVGTAVASGPPHRSQRPACAWEPRGRAVLSPGSLT